MDAEGPILAHVPQNDWRDSAIALGFGGIAQSNFETASLDHG